MDLQQRHAVTYYRKLVAAVWIRRDLPRIHLVIDLVLRKVLVAVLITALAPVLEAVAVVVVAAFISSHCVA